MVSRTSLRQFANWDNFGVVPALNLHGKTFCECSIVLEIGRHVGPHRGFGAKHIWAEHKLEMVLAGFPEENDVSAYVAHIIKTGTPLFYEGSSWRRSRLMAVRSRSGTVILEYRTRRDGPVWTIVTAFSGTKTHGTRVGTVR